jgi:hypothetical protein
MEKEFIPYEQALALKDLGFSKACLAWYDTKHSALSIGESWRSFNSSVFTPTFSQAFKWFREKYDVYFNIDYDWNDEVFRVIIMQQNNDKSCKITHLKEKDYIKEFKSYEEAELACLKKLIKIKQNEKN